MDQQARDLVIKARVILQKTHPFFSFLAMRLQPIEETKIPTMAVDADGHMYYNPDWTKKLTLDQAKGVVCHEVMHVALEHLKNLKGRQADIANVAMDMVINEILVENQIQLPKEGLIPQGHACTVNGNITIKDLNKKVWEQVYAELEKKLPKKPQGGYGGFDEHIRKKPGEDGEGQGGKGKKDKGDDWKQTLNDAHAYAKMQGKSPAGMDRYIEELNYPELNWKEMLQKFIIREIPFDFNYTRPSKKSVSTGVFLPSVLRENLEIAVGVDTSGSMSPQDLKDCVSEVLGIIRAYDCVKLTVIACDAEVHRVEDVKDESDLLNFKFGGGGGTDFKPVFKWLEDNKPNLKLLIFFTDGYGDFPEGTPNVKTLWCISENGVPLDKIPFGEAVGMKKYKEVEQAESY